MKFFLPFADDAEQEERVYATIRQFLGTELGAHFADDRIYRLRYFHGGREYTVTIGEATPLNGEQVLAILYEPGRKLYHVCTPSRGVVRGMSILVGSHEVRERVDFEAG